MRIWAENYSTKYYGIDRRYKSMRRQFLNLAVVAVKWRQMRVELAMSWWFSRAARSVSMRRLVRRGVGPRRW
jgi:hypothetical protein